MKNERNTIILLLTISVIMIIISVLSLFFLRDVGYTYTVAGYVVFGIGFGLLGDALGRLNMMRLEKKDPERTKDIRVAKNDERNLAIDEKAKAKTFSFAMCLNAAVLIVLVVMRVELRAILILLTAYFLTVIYTVFVKFKLYKEM